MELTFKKEWIELRFPRRMSCFYFPYLVPYPDIGIL